MSYNDQLLDQINVKLGRLIDQTGIPRIKETLEDIEILLAYQTLDRENDDALITTGVTKERNKVLTKIANRSQKRK